MTLGDGCCGLANTAGPGTTGCSLAPAFDTELSDFLVALLSVSGGGGCLTAERLNIFSLLENVNNFVSPWLHWCQVKLHLWIYSRLQVMVYDRLLMIVSLFVTPALMRECECRLGSSKN